MANFLFWLTVAIVCTIALFLLKRRDAKVEASIVPGNYIYKNRIDNPFSDEYDYVKVHEVKDGWVRYSYTLNRTGSMYSTTVENFAFSYAHYPLSEG